MTKAEAKKLCIKKWEWIVENSEVMINYARMYKELPELEELLNNCGYCELYLFSKNCRKCPLVKIHGQKENCNRDNSTYMKWARTPSLQNAQKMLDLIKQT